MNQPEPIIIGREHLLDDIKVALNKNRTVIIEGLAGSGKTTLVEQFIDKYSKRYDMVVSYRGADLEMADGRIPIKLDQQGALFVLDGYNEIVRDEVKEELYKFIRNPKKDIDTIITARLRTDYRKVAESAQILRLPNFSHEEVYRLIYAYQALIRGLKLSESDSKLIRDVSNQNPLVVKLILDLMTKGKSLTDIVSLVENDVKYRNKLFSEYEEASRIITVEPPKLITDVRVINNDISQLIKNDPEKMHKLSAPDFERFALEFFEKHGYQVTPTQQTRDGGKDLFIIENSRLGKFIYYVECKKNAPHRPIGVNIVRELYGTVQADRVTAGIVVTSSYFSEPAKDFTEQIKHQMSLIDFVDLKKWLTEM